MTSRILLVDDHPLFLAGIRGILELEEDMAIIGEANDGFEAIRKTRELDPDLVIMDISMPNLDGIEATRQIIRLLPRIRVLAISIHSGKRFVKEMLDAGAAGYLLKDSAPDEMVTAIRKIMNGDMFLSPAVTSAAMENDIPADQEFSLEILKTRFIQAPITEDQIVRTHVIEKLEQHLDRPLSLIAAPAGYGKSTSVSMWLKNTKSLNTWLSLDETMNDLREFLTYFCQAVENIFPDVLQKTKRQLTASDLPKLALICNTLINELHLIEETFILVLDDYHLIHNRHIHELIGEILLHPPAQFHLSIITRHDPPLDLQSLRSYGRLCEIRMDDLSFNENEIGALVDRELKIQISPENLRKIMDRTEGWITGIRLALYSMRNPEDVERIVAQLKGNFYSISEFLFEEVLNTQPAEIQSLMLKTSILDLFSVELLEDIFLQEAEHDEEQVSAKVFVDELIRSNLFIQTMDLEDRWYRYHHLLKDLLQKQLEKRFPKEAIHSYHVQVSQWFESRNLIDDAIKHAMKAGNIQHAAEIVEQNRYAILNEDRGEILGQWLKLLPEEVILERVELLMARAGFMFVKFDFNGFNALLETAENLLEGKKSHTGIRGEIDFFKGYFSYFEGKGAESEDYIKSAIKKIPEQFHYLKGEADLHYALILQMNGRTEAAISYLKQIEKEIKPLPLLRKTRIWGGVAFIRILEGQLTETLQNAVRIKERARKDQLLHAELWGIYLEALVSYFWNDLDRAMLLCQHLVDYSYALNVRLVADVEVMLMNIYYERNESVKLDAALDRMSEFSRNIDDSSFSVLHTSCLAHLSILKGDVENAMKWLRELEQYLDEELMLWWLEIPRITACRILVAEGSKESLHSAQEKLGSLLKESRVQNNILQRIDLLVLKALTYKKLDQNEAGMEVLMEAIQLGEPGKIIRPFCIQDLSLYGMLMQLQQKDLDSTYLNSLLEHIRRGPGQGGTSRMEAADSPLPQWSLLPVNKDHLYLTARETEIIKLLHRGMRNKDIADALFVSEATIKKHMGNIFKKLEVTSRFQLMQKVNSEGVVNPD